MGCELELADVVLTDQYEVATDQYEVATDQCEVVATAVSLGSRTCLNSQLCCAIACYPVDVRSGEQVGVRTRRRKSVELC